MTACGDISVSRYCHAPAVIAPPPTLQGSCPRLIRESPPRRRRRRRRRRITATALCRRVKPRPGSLALPAYCKTTRLQTVSVGGSFYNITQYYLILPILHVILSNTHFNILLHIGEY